MACILFWSFAVRIHDSQAYRKMIVTRERISRILELREILSEKYYRQSKLVSTLSMLLLSVVSWGVFLAWSPQKWASRYKKWVRNPDLNACDNVNCDGFREASCTSTDNTTYLFKYLCQTALFDFRLFSIETCSLGSLLRSLTLSNHYWLHSASEGQRLPSIRSPAYCAPKTDWTKRKSGGVLLLLSKREGETFSQLTFK